MNNQIILKDVAITAGIALAVAALALPAWSYLVKPKIDKKIAARKALKGLNSKKG